MMIESVQLRSQLLLNIADILARNIDLQFGVVLGYREDGSKLVVLTSFEIITKSNSVDYDYLYKRHGQLKLVYPQCLVLGIYQILSSSNEPNSSTVAMSQEMQHFCNTYQIPLVETPIYLTYNSSSQLQSRKKLPFQAYFADSSTPVTTVIDLSETESIAALTIENHKAYFIANGKKNREEVNIKKHVEKISKTLSILDDKLHTSSIATTSDSKAAPASREEDLADQNANVLSNKLSSLREIHKDTATEEATILKLQTTQLALLTEQKMVLENVQNQFLKQLRLK
ncbi:uncharacterized protein LODBEIA_P44930 [Lodderomyces beijingensis]|uniref:JAB1/MPN/MOV34 metalloenzyme domain-containing protein n=1 Tax=Lodderomyces beijingensis TaxID=1775926 RepID=A0ABP0ZQ49_9ASCO